MASAATRSSGGKNVTLYCPGFVSFDSTFIAATAKGDIAQGSIAYKTIFAVGMTLFVMTFVMNAISIRFVRKYRQVYE